MIANYLLLLIMDVINCYRNVTGDLQPHFRLSKGAVRMKYGRTYLYILAVLLAVIGVAGGAVYWRTNHQEFRTQQARKQANNRKREQALNVEEKKRQAKVNQTAPKKLSTKSSKQTTRVTKYLNRNHFVGSALIVKNNRIIYRKGFGYANYATKQRNSTKSEYQILSVQKSLTAVMAMKLIHQGKLSLNTRLSKYYPKVKNARNITIRNLMDMDSGLVMNRTGSYRPLKEKEVVKYATEHVINRSPRNKDWYQPVNFVLLAGIISKITHTSYKKYFDKLFTRPLKLKGTGFVQQWESRPNRTLGYHWLKSTQIKQNYDKQYHEARASMQNELGTGQVFMTAWDLYKTEQHILRGNIIPQSNVALLHQPGSNAPYGGGIYNQNNGIRSHGIGYGYESSIFITRNGRSGVVLLSNDYRPANSIQDLAAKLFDDVAV